MPFTIQLNIMTKQEKYKLPNEKKFAETFLPFQNMQYAFQYIPFSSTLEMKLKISL